MQQDHNVSNAFNWLGPLVIMALIAIPATLAYKTFSQRTAKVTIISTSDRDSAGHMTVKVAHEDRYGVKRDCEMTVKAEASADGKGALITPISQNCDTAKP